MISPPTLTSSRFVLEHSTTRDDGPRGAALPLSSAGAHPTSRRTAPRRVPAASGGGQGGLQLRRRAQVRAPFLRCRRSACRHAARAPPAGRRVRGSDSTDPSRSTAGLSLSAAPRAAAPKLTSERPARRPPGAPAARRVRRTTRRDSPRARIRHPPAATAHSLPPCCSHVASRASQRRARRRFLSGSHAVWLHTSFLRAMRSAATPRAPRRHGWCAMRGPLPMQKRACARYRRLGRASYDTFGRRLRDDAVLGAQPDIKRRVCASERCGGGLISRRS